VGVVTVVLGFVVADAADDFDGVSAGDPVDPSVGDGGRCLTAESLTLDHDSDHDRAGVEHDHALLSVEKVPSVVDVALGVPELEQSSSDTFSNGIVENVFGDLLEFVGDGGVHAGEVGRDLVGVVAFLEFGEVVDGLLRSSSVAIVGEGLAESLVEPVGDEERNTVPVALGSADEPTPGLLSRELVVVVLEVDEILFAELEESAEGGLP